MRRKGAINFIFSAGVFSNLIHVCEVLHDNLIFNKIIFLHYITNLCRNLQQTCCYREGALSEDLFKAVDKSPKICLESDSSAFIWQPAFQMLD